MKEYVKVAAVQMGCVSDEVKANISKMKELFLKVIAKDAETDLIVFPGLIVSGYNPISVDQAVESMKELAKEYNTYIVFGMAEADDKVYESAVLVGPEGLIGTQRRIHIVNGEKGSFNEWNEIKVFDTELGKLGLIIGVDAHYPEVARVMALNGAEIFCVVANWPEVINGQKVEEVWNSFLATRAVDNKSYLIASNKIGNDSGETYFGGSKIVKPEGAIMAEADKAEDIVFGELDGKEELLMRSFLPYIWNRRPEGYQPIVE